MEERDVRVGEALDLLRSSANHDEFARNHPAAHKFILDGVENRTIFHTSHNRKTGPYAKPKAESLLVRNNRIWDAYLKDDSIEKIADDEDLKPETIRGILTQKKKIHRILLKMTGKRSIL